MGNGLRKAIRDEEWQQVSSMLDTRNVQERIRTKRYKNFGKRREPITLLEFILSPNPSANNTEEVEEEERVNVLHLVQQKRVPLEIVQKIVEISPALVQQVSSRNEDLPLHVAVRHHTHRADRRDIVQFLLEHYPNSIATKNGSGQTALHSACESRSSAQIIELLHGYFPDAAAITNDNDQTPWDVLQAKTGFWNFFYRRRIRRILQEMNNRSETTGLLQKNGGDDDNKSFDSCNSEENPFGSCVLCWDGQADHVLIGCGHICLCSRCSGTFHRLFSLNGKCPVCSKAFTGKPMRVYNAGVVSAE